MNRNEILAALNKEIESLTSARDLLIAASPVATRSPGRPKEAAKKKTSSILVGVATQQRRRPMSAEGRARVAEAQRKRWAAVKKANKAKPPATKQSPVARKVVPSKKTEPAGARTVTTTPRKPIPKKAPAKKSTPLAATPTSGAVTESTE